ncbi:hypothetical protein PCANC_07074 [Puccinia coronata f. sp. avenae]|uniref:Uncharacterized protein n=1 Tax=Puccinia coronata f. sp. avenae TaxID=200324 RepID=A0A2N5VZN1_9BASI|nr:hypothetical protein PCANC_07074 [Puccinia coronata f. sp. avenae]
MDQQTLLENILESQSEILASSSTITSVISNTAGILLDQDKDPKGAPKRGGCIKGQLANLPQDFEGGYQRLFKDYFAESPVYTSARQSACWPTGVRLMQTTNISAYLKAPPLKVFQDSALQSSKYTEQNTSDLQLPKM